MSNHTERLKAIVGQLSTDEQRSNMLLYLVGALGFHADDKRITIKQMVSCFESAADYVLGAEERTAAYRLEQEKAAASPAAAAGYGDPELDGTRCISCHEDFLVGEASIPAGVIDGAGMVFAHRRCIFPPRTDDTAVPPAVSEPEGSRLGDDEIKGTDVVAELAAAVIEEWVPASVASLPKPRKVWVHSGPCVYCSHGPGCVTCDLAEGPHWGTGAAGQEYPGPVCGNCSAELMRRESAADPFYSGDYVTMFGDDE